MIIFVSRDEHCFCVAVHQEVAQLSQRNKELQAKLDAVERAKSRVATELAQVTSKLRKQEAELQALRTKVADQEHAKVQAPCNLQATVTKMSNELRSAEERSKSLALHCATEMEKAGGLERKVSQLEMQREALQNDLKQVRRQLEHAKLELESRNAIVQSLEVGEVVQALPRGSARAMASCRCR